MDIAGAAEAKHYKKHQTKWVKKPQFGTKTRQVAELTLPRSCAIPSPVWKHSTPEPALCSDSTAIFPTDTDFWTVPKLKTRQV